MNFFITGSDTGVGKTYFTALLTQAARRAGLGTVALKPFCCGSHQDVEILSEAAENELRMEEINPVYFDLPTAPLAAARAENRMVDLMMVGEWFRKIRQEQESVLVEGAGGWLVPLTPTETVADLAVMLDLPVLVVVANKLGCLNHTLLTVESIRAHGLTCAGLVLNTLSSEQTPATQTNKTLLEDCCDAPVLFELQPGQDHVSLGVV